MKRTCSVLIAIAAVSASAYAMPGAGRTTEPKADREFVVKAVESGLAEVDLGKLAEERASTPQARQFGQQMVADNMKEYAALQHIAAAKNITVPTGPDRSTRALRARLELLTGPAFDRAYLTAMVSGHAEDVSEFSREVTWGRDRDVATFASNALPTVEDQLRLAETTKQTLSSDER